MELTAIKAFGPLVFRKILCGGIMGDASNFERSGRGRASLLDCGDGVCEVTALA